jgi:YbbR domain-containing protein
MKPLKIVTGNWGLKLLALVLAIVLYHAVKQTTADGTSTERKNDRIQQTP